MADTVQLVLVLHNHQPVGNFDAVIHEACDRAYLPFLEMLMDHPQVSIGLHTSGCLWEWMEHHRPEYGKLVGELHRRGQLELLGGGMYEPILPILPRRDALRQLTTLNSFLTERFGCKPRGMWCPERVWEPHLPEVIAAAGLEYTLLDDYHFRSSVLEERVATDYFNTEHAGSQTKLLPISRKLRYTMPFKPAKDTFDYLKTLMKQARDTPLVVFGDDGEKFGNWPETYEWVYEKGWLKEFLTTLEDNLGWIDLLLPSEMLDKRRPAGKVFVPCTSYVEMGEWTRVDPDASKDDPPGFWRNYLHKYPEVNAMYRRMLEVSKLVERFSNDGGDRHIVAETQADIGRAQCNCAYWHGVFGGLYLNYLRQAISHHIIKAEQTVLDHRPDLAGKSVQVTDHDGLGHDQVVLRDSSWTVIADPGCGLCLTRIDYRPTYFCWSDVLTRRREAYHAKVLSAGSDAKEEHGSIHDLVRLKEEGLQEKLVFDDHRRVSFTTYFSTGTAARQFRDGQPPPDADSLYLYPDYYCSLDRMRTTATDVSGTADLGTYTLSKSIRQVTGGVILHCAHSGGTLPAESGRFMVEFNLTVLTDKAEDRFLEVNGKRRPLDAAADFNELHRLRLVDGYQGCALRLESTQLRTCHYYPVYTVSSSEGGFESTYQGSCLILAFDPQALICGFDILLTVDTLDSNVMHPGEL